MTQYPKVQINKIREDILDYLKGWYERSKARQIENGIVFNLSFDEWLDLWGSRRIRSLTEWMDDGSLYARQGKKKETAYVLSWVSYAAKQTGEMNIHTAQICTRAQSKLDIRMKQGDKHSDEVKAVISAKTAGVPKSEDHRAKISASMTGIKRGPMSEEEKRKRSEAVKATLAAKKAAKLAAQQQALVEAAARIDNEEK